MKLPGLGFFVFDRKCTIFVEILTIHMYFNDEMMMQNVVAALLTQKWQFFGFYISKNKREILV